MPTENTRASLIITVAGCRKVTGWCNHVIIIHMNKIRDTHTILMYQWFYWYCRVLKLFPTIHLSKAPAGRYMVQVRINTAPDKALPILFEVAEKGMDFISNGNWQPEEALIHLLLNRQNDRNKAKSFFWKYAEKADNCWMREKTWSPEVEIRINQKAKESRVI